MQTGPDKELAELVARLVQGYGGKVVVQSPRRIGKTAARKAVEAYRKAHPEIVNVWKGERDA